MNKMRSSIQLKVTRKEQQQKNSRAEEYNE